MAQNPSRCAPVFVASPAWLVDADRPIADVRYRVQSRAEILWQARKIGYDQIVGELDGGLTTWTDLGRSRLIAFVSAQCLEGLPESAVHDVREAGEFGAGHVQCAVQIELVDVATVAGAAPSGGPRIVMSGRGERAMGAASLLARTGHREDAVLDDGPADWTGATGRPLEGGA